VGGAGPQEQAFHTLARKAIAALGLDVIDLTPLPIGEVMARVATLPEHTIIFAVTYQMDGAGHRFHGLDIVGPLAATANAPLFTATNVAALGRGIVGGSLIDFEAVGREAGTIANRVLRGEATPRSPVASAATNRLFFDGRQLARWQLDERRLPNDREVIFSQRTLWGQYRWHILGAAGIIAGQAALIVALLVQRRRRREAVTALRQVEAVAQRQLRQIIQLDRVAAMGTLASSIAHELNQPLAGILANAQAANRRLADSQPDLDEVRACLADIVDDDRRAADVIRGMRRLLRKADVVAAPISLNDLAANTIRLVTNDARLQEVTIDFEPAPGLPLTSGDPVQIQQVILNLLTNAIAAAANGGAPRNTVRVWTTTATPPFIELGVNDSGKGILEPDLQRIFEPFFTTKPDGLGIGLTISRTIVEAHGGRLVVENDPRGGATFRVNLRTDESPTS
jgi:signal transduction histidine kinase